MYLIKTNRQNCINVKYNRSDIYLFWKRNTLYSERNEGYVDFVITIVTIIYFFFI